MDFKCRLAFIVDTFVFVSSNLSFYQIEDGIIQRFSLFFKFLFAFISLIRMLFFTQSAVEIFEFLFHPLTICPTTFCFVWNDISGFLLSFSLFDILFYLLFILRFPQGRRCAAFAPSVAQYADEVTFRFFLEPSQGLVWYRVLEESWSIGQSLIWRGQMTKIIKYFKDWQVLIAEF